jgi:muramoyltetrapeptide carboxypeptidase
MSVWMNDDVSAVIAGRGGYGTQRMLDLLDWRRLVEATPKILVGFSDVTALHQAVASRLGLVTLHGHLVTTLGAAGEPSIEAMRRLLFEPRASDLFADESTTLRPVVQGSATGVLTGGNLTLLASEVGTALHRPARNGIVLVEDVDEEPFRIDRMLTQLIRSGWFEGVQGLVLGAFTDCGDEEELQAVLFDRLVPLGVPIVAGFTFGHTPATHSVPFGVTATLDVPAGNTPPALRLAKPPFTD